MDCNHIFDQLGYDVIVAITQQAINGQLLLLSDPDVGSINTNVVLAFPPSQGVPNHTIEFYQSFDDVPKVTTADGRVVPQWATLQGRFTPTFSIARNNPSNDDGSPQKVALTMTWAEGTLYGAADSPNQTWNITGWTWEASVNLKVSIITHADVTAGLTVPFKVLAELDRITSSGTDALGLALDFSEGLNWSCRTGAITDPAASVANHDAMLPYFDYFVKNPRANPYFLAFNVAGGSAVPPSLSPIGCTFSLFHDTASPDHSTVNFIFNTKSSPTGGSNPVPGRNAYPGTLANNLVAPSEQCDGKVLYSARCFLAEFLIRPMVAGFGGDGADLATGKGHYALYSRPNQELDGYTEGARASMRKNSLVVSGTCWKPHDLGTIKWSWLSVSDCHGGINDQDEPVLVVPQPRVSGNEVPDWIFQKAMEVTTPPGTFAQAQIMLPLGDYFFAKDMMFLEEGVFSTEVTMKSPTGAVTLKASSAPAEFVVVENKIGKLIARKPLLSASAPGGLLGAPPSEAESAKPGKNLSTEPNLGAPMQDHVSLDLLDQAASPKVDITVSSELMHNSKVAMPLTGGDNMIAAQDATGHPLICSIGNTDKALNILVANSGETNSGWTTTNVLESFPDHHEASLFDLKQETDGTWSLGFVARNRETSANTVFFASLLSNDLGKTDISKLSTCTLTVEGIDPGFNPESIRVGSSINGARPLLTVEGSLGGKHILYQLAAEDGASAQRLELPEDMTPGAENLLDHCTGAEYGFSSNYFLYKIGQAQRLIAYAQNRSTSSNPASLAWDYSDAIQDGACHCVATCPVPDTARFSDLYFAGAAGVFRIPDGVKTLKERVSDPAIVGEVTKLAIAHDGGQVAVWSTNIKDELYYTRGIRTPGSKAISWGTPFLFATNIVRVAPTRSFARQTNELFCLTKSAVLHHYWQDPSSTMWRKRTGHEDVKATVINYDSYTTHVHFEQDGMPVSRGMELSVTSSEWQYVTINNVVYSIHGDTPATVSPDAMGNVTIICEAVDTAPPVIHISSAQFAETLNIYPSGKVHKLMANVTDGNSLQTARDQSGKAVLPDGVDSDVTNGIADRVQAVHTSGSNKYPPASAGNTFLVVEHPANVSPSGLKHTLMTPIPPDSGAGSGTGKPLFAMTMSNGKWRMMDATELETHAATQPHGSAISLGGIFDWIGEAVGDAWHAIENAADYLLSKIEDAVVYVGQGISFVLNQVEQGLELVVNLVGKVMKFVLNTCLQVFKAISSLLKLIGIDISAILRWLGHLFGWDTIWDTHKLIASTLKNFVQFGVTSTEKYLEIARSEARGAFANLDQRLKDLEPKASTMLSAQSPIKLATSGPSVNDSPQANFAYYHYQNAVTGVHMSDSSSTKLQAANGNLQEPSGFGNLFETVIMPIVNDIVPKLGADVVQLLKVFKTGSVNDIIIFFVDLLTTIVDTVGDVVDVILVTFGQIISQLGEALETEFDLPVLSALYQFVTALMGEEESFSVINGFSFIAAVAISATLGITGATQLPDRNTMGCADPDFPVKLEAAVCGHVSLRSGEHPVDEQASLQVSLGKGSPDAGKAMQQYSLIAGQVLNITNVLCAFANGIGSGAGADQAALVTSVTSTIFGFPIPAGEDQPLDTWIQRVLVWAASSAVSIVTSVPKGVSSRIDGLFQNPGSNDKRIQGGLSLLVGVIATGAAIEIDVREHSDALTWMSDTLGNLGSIGMGAGDFSGEPEVKVAAIGGTLFGAMAASAAWVSSEQGETVFKRIVTPF